MPFVSFSNERRSSVVSEWDFPDRDPGIVQTAPHRGVPLSGRKFSPLDLSRS